MMSLHANPACSQAQARPVQMSRLLAPRSLHRAFQSAAGRAPALAGRPCRHAQPRTAKLQVRAVYGSQWSTPGDAYVTVVSGGCGGSGA